MRKFPPQSYILTKSAVEGIQVFMPRPRDEADKTKELHQDVVTFNCPQCAATTAYSTENGGLTCTYCNHYEPSPQEIVGKYAEEFEFDVETMHRVAHGWGVERKELVCNSCAAHTTLSPDMLTHTCPFCGSNNVIQQKAPQDVLRPRFLIPFRITQDDCRKITSSWLQKHWMMPPNLRKMARVVDYTPIYIPFWTFNAATKATWQAEIEGYRSGKSNRWTHEKGSHQIDFNDFLVSATQKINNTLLKEISGYDLNNMVAYDASYLAGVQAHAFEYSFDQSWEITREQMRTLMSEACKQSFAGKRCFNFSMRMQITGEGWRYILLPVYITTYKYNKLSWQVMINGQTGTIAGQRPIDWTYVCLVMLSTTLPGLALIITTIITHRGQLMPGACVLLAISGFISKKIFEKAQTMENI